MNDENMGSLRMKGLPPHSIEAEIGLLGAILLDSAQVMDLCVEKQIGEESFYDPKHALVFEAILALYNASRPVDLLTVAERLKLTGNFEKIGGISFLSRLVDATPTSAHAEYYMDAVWDRHLMRRVIDAGRKAEQSCYDPEMTGREVLANAEQLFFGLSSSQRQPGLDWAELLTQMKGLLNNDQRGMEGLQTGFGELDTLIGGLKPANMVVLAARPSMGKTSLAMNIVENIALGRHINERQGRAVGVFSLEMSAMDLVKRMVCCHAEVNMRTISQGFISKENHVRIVTALDTLKESRIFLDDSAGLDITELRARARRMKVKRGVELIVIDYLQLLHCKEMVRQGRQNEIAAVSGGIKEMAKELNIPVLVLSQLSRNPESRGGDQIPQLSDLRDSGSIEQDADIVMLLRRPSRILTAKRENDGAPVDDSLAIVQVAKNRNGPAMEDVNLHFDEHLTRFRNRAKAVDG